MSVRTAAIVGAGIGGLAAGIALRQAGWRVRIFERASTPRQLGFALNLAPNAIRALEELGLAAPVIAAGSVLAGVELRRADGRVLKRFTVPSASKRTPSVAILRTALLGVLLNATEPESLVFDREATGIQDTPAGVALAFRGGRSELADIVVGADGVGSAIRGFIHPGEPPPRPSGYFGIRGVAYGVTDLLEGTSAVGYLGRGIEAATLRASAEAIYWYMSLLAEDVEEVTGAPDAFAERHARRLHERFRAVVRATAREDVRVDELRDRDPVATWGRGRVTLLGDAAHPMLPHTGQGAAQALEDAVALGVSLASGGATDALRRYEQVRFRRTRGIVTSGRRIARVTTTKRAGVCWLRDTALRLVPAGPLLSAYLLGSPRDPHRALRPPVLRS